MINKKIIILFCFLIIIIGYLLFSTISFKTIREDIITFTIKEESLTNLKATFILTNNTNETYSHNSYSIEKEWYGIWHKVNPINKIVNGMIAFNLEPKESKEIAIDWGYSYGKLKPGKYRVIKDIYLNKNGDIPNKRLYITAEFIIK